MSGKSEKKIQGALALHLANQKNLDRCAGHDFNQVVDSPTAIALWGLVVFVRCAHCAGEVEAQVAEWYERGLEHGRKRPSRR